MGGSTDLSILMSDVFVSDVHLSSISHQNTRLHSYIWPITLSTTVVPESGCEQREWEAVLI